ILIVEQRTADCLPPLFFAQSNLRAIEVPVSEERAETAGDSHTTTVIYTETFLKQAAVACEQAETTATYRKISVERVDLSDCAGAERVPNTQKITVNSVSRGCGGSVFRQLQEAPSPFWLRT